MIPNKIDKKWYGLIWFSLIFSCFIQNAYAIYHTFAAMTDAAANKITLQVLEVLFFDGLLPALIGYLCIILLFSLAWNRGLRMTSVINGEMRFISRNDFVYTAMIFTAAAKALIGIIAIFSLLDPNLNIYVELVVTMTIYAISYYIMYFAVLKPGMNIVVLARVFGFFSSVYLTVLGIIQIMPAIGVFLIHSGMTLPEQFTQMFDISTLTTSQTFYASIASVAVFATITLVTIIIAQILNSKAKKSSQTNQIPGQFNPSGTNFYGDPAGGNPFGNTNDPAGSDGGADDGGNPFEDFGAYDGTNKTTGAEKGKDKDENVFDEFDI